MSTPVFAEAPKTYSTFSAKRVKPPAPGSKNRINVQIDPTEPVYAAPIKPASTEVEDSDTTQDIDEPIGRYAWFWEKVSPEIASSGPGRLDSALAILNGSGQVTAPRLQALQEIASAQGIPILRSTIGTNVSPALVLAVISVESNGKANAVSGAGASGLMQLMPATADRFGVKDRMVAEDNIAGGVKYLNFLMQEFDSDPILVLAGYNAGEGSIRNHQGVPPFAETRDYVPKVLAAFQVARGLCTTPPELISDGCVFNIMN
ncbi:MAG: lytic transglycosylase domain-containing protein [Rhodobacteraceae bacterium]|nr:lytic transglycosylase domain-containing protein [Paracoccaceae bacterium]